jgi:hypothetical protein
VSWTIKHADGRTQVYVDKAAYLKALNADNIEKLTSQVTPLTKWLAQPPTTGQ